MNETRPISRKPRRNNHQRRRPASGPPAAKPEKPGLVVRETCALLLARMVDDGRGLDGLLTTRHGPAALQAMSADDRKLTRAIATTAMRHRGFVDHALRSMMSRKPPGNARHLIHTLHVAAAQILFLTVPDSAAVDLAVTSLTHDQRSARFSSFGNAVLRRLCREKEVVLAKAGTDEHARLNMPDWLWKRTRKSYGREKALAIAKMHLHEPVIDLTVKENPEHWARELDAIPTIANTIRTTRPGGLETWPGYGAGAWWVQDAAASLPAHLLGDIKDKTVADLCAAPGGKTAQLIMAGANVVAVEANADRATRLANNLKRLKLDAQIVHADLFEWQPEKLFDAILLDAPCSSTGTIRRHPDVAWSKSADQVEALAQLQRDMILHVAGFLKPGGVLVFSNCSLDRAEGEDVYAQVCDTFPELEPMPLTADDVFGRAELITGQGTVRTLPFHLPNEDRPSMGGMDGFFAARFRKVET